MWVKRIRKSSASHTFFSRRALTAALLCVLSITGINQTQAANLNVPSSYSTIAAAIAAAVAGDTIIINNTYTVGSVQTAAIAKALNYRSATPASRATIKLSSTNGRFSLTTGAQGSTFSDLIFTGAYNVTNGAAIYNASGGAITISNSLFDTITNNDATASGNLQGGVINNAGANTQIINTIFQNNSTTRTGYGYIRGGVLHNTGANLIITGSEFNNNYSGTNTANPGSFANYIYGGAIYNTGAGLTIEGTKFNNNQNYVWTEKSGDTDGGAYGAAIRNESGGSNLKITDSEFINNSNYVHVYDTHDVYSYTQGGAIYNVATNAVISSSIFRGNSNYSDYTGTSTGLNIYAHGGAIYTTGTMTINNSIFENNTTRVNTVRSVAPAYGGAIYTTAVITINGGTFTNNQAVSNISGGALGGAIYNASTLNLNSTAGDIIFSGNTTSNAGVVAANDIHTTSIININGTTGNVYLGGGVTGSGTITKSNGGTLTLGVDSLNNSYTGTFTQTGGLTKVLGKFFGGTTNNINGGTLEAVVSSTRDLSYIFGTRKPNMAAASTFKFSSALGSAFNISSASVLTNYITFLTGGSNVIFATDSSISKAQYILGVDLALSSGGANNVTFDNSNVALSGANVINNTNTNYTFQNNSLLTTTGTTNIGTNTGSVKFINNTSAGNGGALLNSGTLSLSGDITFDNNSAVSGGAIYNTGILNVNDTTFTNNSADSYGGAIYNSGTLNIDNSSFTNNNADGNAHYGGAIYNTGGATTNVTSSGGEVLFQGNGATTYGGGAIYGTGAGTTINVTSTGNDIKFINNNADYGGAIEVITSARANIQASNGDIIFSGNTSNNSGGAIYNGVDSVTTLTSTSGGDIIFTGNKNNGANNDIWTNSTLNINGTAGKVSMGGGISGSGTITKSNSGILELAAGSINSSFTGAFNQTGGTTNASSTFFGGSTNLSGGTINLNNGSNLASTSTIAITNSTANLNFNQTSGNNISINGTNITGTTGNINKTGTNTLTISGNTAYSGTYNQSAGKTTFIGRLFNNTSNITGGTLELATGSSLNTNSKISLGQNATLDISTSDNNITLSNTNLLSNSGTYGNINKTGSGTLTLTGDLSSYDKTFTQTGGTTSKTTVFGKLFGNVSNIIQGTLELANGSSVAPTSKIAISNQAQLDISNTTAPLTLDASNIIGYNDGTSTTYGNINKTGSGTLTLTGDNSNYLGIFTQTAGTTNLTKGSKLFGNTSSNNLINGGNLNITLGTSSDMSQYLTLNGGQLNYISDTSTRLDISNTILSRMVANAANNLITFNTSTVDKSKYNIVDDISISGSATTNTLEFINSDVTFSSNNYLSSDYSFKNSNINLTSDADAATTTFADLTVDNNTYLSFDVKFSKATPTSPVVVTADKLINQGTAQTIKLGTLIFRDTTDDGIQGTHTIDNILTGLTFQPLEGTYTYATTVYEYMVDLTGDLRGIILSFTGFADENSLNKMNILQGLRVFSFSHFDDNDTHIYQIGANLDTTAAGNDFTVTGSTSGPTKNIISGLIKNGAGARGSFFKLANQTNLTIKDVTIREAYSASTGSVLSSTNSSAETLISSAIIGSNTASEGNVSTGNGGAVYLAAGTLTIGGTTFKNNTSTTGLGGAIYNNDRLYLDSSLGNILFEDNLANGVINDIYNSASGRIFINGNSGTVEIKGGIAGYGEITKSNDGILSLTSNNSTYLGDFTQTGGTTNVSNTYFGGSTELSGGTINLNNGSNLASTSTIEITGSTANLNLNQTSGNNFTVNNAQITGTTGNINKTGAGTLTLNGDQSGYTGTFNQTGGTTSKTTVFGKLFGNVSNIIQGTLELANGSSVAPTSKIAISNQAQLDISNTTGTIALDASNIIGYNTEYGDIYKKNAGGLNLTGDFVSNTNIFHQQNGITTFNNGLFNNTINVTGGVLKLDTNSFFNNDTVISLASGSTLDIATSLNNITLTTDNFIGHGSTPTYGTITKTGTGTLTINDDFSLYTNVFNQSAGTTDVLDVFFGGNTTLSGGTINLEDGSSLASTSVINLTGSSSALNINHGTGEAITITGGQITGTTGNVNKTDSGTLTLSGDNSSFSGTFTQTGGVTVVTEGSKMFGNASSDNLIQGGNLNVMLGTSSDMNQYLTLDGGQLNYSSNTVSRLDVSTANLSNVSVKSDNALITFDSNIPLDKAKYTLVNDITLNGVGTDTKIEFINSDVNLNPIGYTATDNIYSFKDSVIRLTGGGNSTTTFNNLLTDNTSLDFSILFSKSGLSDTVVYADKLINNDLNSNGTQTIDLGRITIIDNYDDGSGNQYELKILDGLEFRPISGEIIYQTTIRRYEITLNSDLDGIILDFIGFVDTDVLYQLNDSTGTRLFDFRSEEHGDGSIYTYNITTSLDETKLGKYTVIGKNNDATKTVISGELNTGLGNGSFFKLIDSANDVELILENLTFTDAEAVYDPGKPNLHTGSGSVIYMNSDKAVASADNVIFDTNRSEINGGAVANELGDLTLSFTQFTNNTAGEHGGAIYNNGTTLIQNSLIEDNLTLTGSGGAIYNDIDGVITINNVFFEGNVAAQDGGAIYNSGDMTIIQGQFTDNTAAGNGGAIYNSGVLKLTADDSKNITFADNSATAGNGIYNIGTIIIDGAGTVSSYDGIAGTTAGIINKEGTGTLNLYGDNTDYLGTFTQTSGTTNLAGADAVMFGGESTISGGIFNWFTDTAKDTDAVLKFTGGILNVGTDAITGALLELNNSSDEIAKNAQLVLAAGSYILNSEGTITLDSADIWNGTIANEAVVNLDNYTRNANATNIYSQSESSAVLNLMNGSHFAVNSDSVILDGTINIGNGTTGNTLEITSGGVIIEDITLNIEQDNSVLVKGGGVNVGSNDDWKGKVELQSGTLVLNDLAPNGVLTTTGGTLYLKSGELDIVTGGSIAKDTTTWLDSGTKLNVSDGDVVLDKNDAWLGEINLSSTGILELDDLISDLNNNILKQDGGELIIRNNSAFGVNDKIEISGGKVSVYDSDIEFLDTAVVSNSTITAENNSNIIINDNAQITNSNLNLFSGSNLYLAPSASLSGINDLIVNGATINVINGTTTNTTINKLIVGALGADFKVDIDRELGTSDTFWLDLIEPEVLGEVCYINVSDFNFIDNAPQHHDLILQIFDFDPSAIAPGTEVEFTATQKTVMTPLGIYSLLSLGGGAYQLQLKAYSQESMRGQVATLASINNQLFVNNMLFDHANLVTQQMLSGDSPNKYAITEPSAAPYQYSREDGGVWYKPYVSLETISMTQNIDVKNTFYGSLVGADFRPIRLENGWKWIPSAYVGYNGGRQSFGNVTMYQTGGQIGTINTLVKGNSQTTTLAYIGGYGNSMSVGGRKDETGNWFAGSAVQTVYNFRPSRNLTIQPTAMFSYNRFGKQNWHSDFGGLAMTSGRYNGISAAPGLNLIYQGEDWSAYLTTQYMFNINDEITGSGGSMDLPDVKLRHGYFNYGVGMTKDFRRDKISTYSQLNLRNGGRTGVGFQAGLTWRL